MHIDSPYNIMTKKALFGPGFVEDLGSENYMERFGPEVKTDIVIDGEPAMMSAQLSDAFEAAVVSVSHKGRDIGVVAPDGFNVTYTEDIETYMPYKDQFEEAAKQVLANFLKKDEAE